MHPLEMEASSSREHQALDDYEVNKLLLVTDGVMELSPSPSAEPSILLDSHQVVLPLRTISSTSSTIAPGDGGTTSETPTMSTRCAATKRGEMNLVMKVAKFVLLLSGFGILMLRELGYLLPTTTTATTHNDPSASSLSGLSSSKQQREVSNDSDGSGKATASDATPDQRPPFVYSHDAKVIPDVEHLPISNSTRKELATAWGYWHFWDGDEKDRPDYDYCGSYPNRDVPSGKYPSTAWQSDAVYVNHLLDDGEKLVNRALEAIFTEYGHGKPLPPDELRARIKMFRKDVVDLATQKDPPDKFRKGGSRSNGGWTTKRSMDGLVRRLLHAMMTNDVFTVVLVGHSAAAGHGNHFRQSYMMQFHKVVAPVLARFGVKLITRNLAQGGLGTIQAALGASSLIGDNIDVLLWDSGMTEPDKAHIDLLIRQAILGGKRVPVIWGGDFYLLKDLHEHADVDVGDFGTGYDAVIPVQSKEQAEQVPYASRYMKCDRDVKEVCDAAPRYCTKCWINRDDIQPEPLFGKIAATVSGQVKWHPGWRHHQLVGRTLAYSLLDALQIAVQQFSDGTMGGPPLDEVYWHVTDYYANIQNKVKNLAPSVGQCYNIADYLPTRLCQVAMKGATLFTPRPNPSETSILRLIRPGPDGHLPTPQYQVLYDGPDKHNPCYDPQGVDVYAIVSGRRQLDSNLSLTAYTAENPQDDEAATTARSSTRARLSTVDADSSKRRQLADPIVPGKGWVHRWEWPGNCDGTYDAICGRHRANNCPLSGHQDSRGFLLGSEESGWLVLDIPKVNNGIIIIKFETWHTANDFKPNRELFQTFSNDDDANFADYYYGFDEDKHDPDVEQRRRLAKLEELPETFAFDYAINGKITTWNKQEFIAQRKQVQRVVETFTLLDDPKFPPAEKVEVAFRLRGCGQQCSFGLTHVYWA